MLYAASHYGTSCPHNKVRIVKALQTASCSLHQPGYARRDAGALQTATLHAAVGRTCRPWPPVSLPAAQGSAPCQAGPAVLPQTQHCARPVLRGT
jgi:hypothetical protein